MIDCIVYWSPGGGRLSWLGKPHLPFSFRSYLRGVEDGLCKTL